MSDTLSVKKQGDRSSYELFKRSVGYFAPYRYRVVIAVAGMLVVAACQGGTAWLVKPMLDDIFIQKNTEALLYIPVIFFLLTFAKVGFRTVQNYTMQYCGLKVLEDLRDELFRKIIYLPAKFYEDTQVGMLMSRIINDVAMIRSSLPSLIMLVRQVVTIIGLMGVVFHQDAELAFWAFIVLPLAFYPFVYFSRRMRKLGRMGQERIADVSTLLQEIFSGIRVIKAFASEKTESVRFDRENRRLLAVALKQSLASEFSSSAMEIVGAIGGGLVVWYGGLKVISGVSTPGTFFSFLTAVALLYDPVKKLSSCNNDIQYALAGADRVFAVLDSPVIAVEKDGDRNFDEPFHSLEFRNLSFSYGGENEMVLRDINLSVRAGEKVAIVGPSGGGKTTFVNMIPRFYEPLQGEILLNGRPVGEYTLSSLRRAVAVVSQDNFLFNMSIRDNIAYGMADLPDGAVERAAAAAFAHEFIMEFPEGYATVVGERGIKLSGGQKQRLTIARALIKDAPLLILDEATSALDSQAEGIVQKALENLMENRTSIVIAHRLSTILNADRILVMEKGRIVAEGRHESLLAASPLYARLYAMQFRGGTGGDGEKPAPQDNAPGEGS